MDVEATPQGEQHPESLPISPPPLSDKSVRVSKLTDVNPIVIYTALTSLLVTVVAVILWNHPTGLIHLGHALASPFSSSVTRPNADTQQVLEKAKPYPKTALTRGSDSSPDNNKSVEIAKTASIALSERRLTEQQQRLAEIRDQAALRQQQADIQLAHERELRMNAEAQAQSQRRALEDAERTAEIERATRESQERSAAEREAKLKAEQESARRAIVQPSLALPYDGPHFGTIRWQGEVHGTELVTIENGRASLGTVTGKLPGVPVLLQPVNNKKVGIASPPAPGNNYQSMVIRVSGSGLVQVSLDWNLP